MVLTFCETLAGSLLLTLECIYSQLLNEIMPMIYKRFTDKTAEEWRQIYKVRYGVSGKRFGLIFTHETCVIGRASNSSNFS